MNKLAIPTLRERVSSYFGLPMGRTPWRLYLASINETGKITARVFLELFMLIFEYLEEKESKQERV